MRILQGEPRAGEENRQYRFGPFNLKQDGTLFRGSEILSLPPKELAILRRLLDRPGQVVSIEELRTAGWGDTHVSVDSLPRCISSLRSRLEPDSCITTIYKRGYRLDVPVSYLLAGNIPVAQPEPIAVLTANAGPSGVAGRRSILRGNLEILKPEESPDSPRLIIFPFKTGVEVPTSFATGIAEETMLWLSRARTRVVDVLASSSVFALADQGLTALEAGQRLDGNLILTGTITSHALHFRLRAEMFRAKDAVQLWVEDFLVPHKLISCADAYLARRISARIRQTVLRPNLIPGKSVSSRNLDAYDAFRGIRDRNRAGSSPVFARADDVRGKREMLSA